MSRGRRNGRGSLTNAAATIKIAAHSSFRYPQTPTFALRIPTLSASGSTDAGETGPPGESVPLYKKAWFLAGLTLLVAGTVVLLASGDGDEEHPSTRESLPGFPPPPDLRLSIGAGSSMDCGMR